MENSADDGLAQREDLSQDLKEGEAVEASKDSLPAKSIFDIAQSRANSKSTSPKAVPDASDLRGGASQGLVVGASQPMSKTRTLRPSILTKQISGGALQLRK